MHVNLIIEADNMLEWTIILSKEAVKHSHV